MPVTAPSRDQLLGRDQGPVAPAREGAPFDIVFVDRDGTLNRHRSGYVTRGDDLDVLPGVPAAVRGLNDAGCRVVLVTNQRGLATGALTEGELVEVHTRLLDDLAAAGAHLDAIQVCPHQVGECGCRKPLPGLFEQALRRAPWARAERCVMVGDQDTDLVPAQGLGMLTARVEEPSATFEEVVRALLMPTI